MITDDEFFSATPELQAIRQWANARFAAVWAVFGAVLLRVAATTEPNVQLPGVIGGRASLNLLAAFVSPSGGGKGISDKVARLVWPADIVERPIGSGEGIAATFVSPKKEGVEPITRAIISVPEIDTLAGLASRQGSILLAQLKSMAMGEQLGQANASDATTRIIAPHTYRGCLSVGAQPTHTGVLFDDSTGGTPQRFLWFLTIDPDMPGDVISDPEPLDTRLPFWSPGEQGVVEIGYGPDEIRETIISAHLARQRGQSEALDGHAMLTRCKVAATLAILHHRSVVSDLDWQLSAKVMEQSTRTRDWVVAEAKRATRQKVRDRALSRAAGDEFYEQSLLNRVKRSIVRMLEADGEQAGNALRSRLGKREKRDLFDQAVGELVHDGLIDAIVMERGSRYRLLGGQGDQVGQGINPQVREGDHVGQGDQLFAATHGSSGDDLPHPSGESTGRQLRAVADPDPKTNDPRPRTCLEWINDHVSDLIASGTDTAQSAEVYRAGQAAGFKIDNLRQAAKSSSLISVVARQAHTAVWRLGAGGENTAVSAPQWIVAWLREQGGWHRPSAVYAAGEKAGYGRSTIKSASQAAHILKRGQSISTEWSLDPNYAQEAS